MPVTVREATTDDIAGRLIRLPFYNSLSQAEQELVADSICRYYHVR